MEPNSARCRMAGFDANEGDITWLFTMQPARGHTRQDMSSVLADVRAIPDEW